MVRLILDDPVDRDAVIRAEADRLLSEYGADHVRTMPLLEQTCQVRDQEGTPKQVIEFIPSLTRAVERLGVDGALDLFSNCDLSDLGRRERLTDFLRRDDTPLYTVRELQKLTGLFMQYLREHPGCILGPTYECEFSLSPWLSMYGTLIYPPMDADLVPEQELWLQLLSDKCRAHIAQCRPKLFDLKLAVLEKIVENLRHDGSNTCLRSKCLETVKATLSDEEIGFWLAAEQVISNYDVFTGKATRAGKERVICGGLADTLELVGHYEEETRIGLYARVRAVLGDLVGAYQANGAPKWRVLDYYDAIACSRQIPMDQALDLFTSMSAETKSFWDEYRLWAADHFQSLCSEAMSSDLFSSRDCQTDDDFTLGKAIYASEPDGKQLDIHYGIASIQSECPPGMMGEFPFFYDESFRRCWLKGVEFSLTKRQALYIKVLYEAYKRDKQPWISVAKLQAEAAKIEEEEERKSTGSSDTTRESDEKEKGSDGSSSKWTDVLRKEDRCRNGVDLVRRGPRRGTVSLNI